jgi:HEAT repeat protein
MAGELAETLLDRAESESFKPLQAEVAAALKQLKRAEFARQRSELAFRLLSNADAAYQTRLNAIDILADTRQMLQGDAIPPQPRFESRFRQALLQAMEAESYFVNAAAIVEYARQGYDDAVEQIQPYQNAYSWNELVRTAVARAMTETEDPAAFDVLFNLATQPGDKEFKSHALQFLGDYISNPEQERAAIDAYLNTLNDPYLANRLQAINALGKRESPEITSALESRFESAEHPTERAALRAVLR